MGKYYFLTRYVALRLIDKFDTKPLLALIPYLGLVSESALHTDNVMDSVKEWQKHCPSADMQHLVGEIGAFLFGKPAQQADVTAKPTSGEKVEPTDASETIV